MFLSWSRAGYKIGCPLPWSQGQDGITWHSSLDLLFPVSDTSEDTALFTPWWVLLTGSPWRLYIKGNIKSRMAGNWLYFMCNFHQFVISEKTIILHQIYDISLLKPVRHLHQPRAVVFLFVLLTGPLGRTVLEINKYIFNYKLECNSLCHKITRGVYICPFHARYMYEALFEHGCLNMGWKIHRLTTMQWSNFTKYRLFFNIFPAVHTLFFHQCYSVQ